jgi:hypothetical protein
MGLVLMRRFFEWLLNYVPPPLRHWYWMYHDPDCPPLTKEQLDMMVRGRFAKGQDDD